MVVWIQASDLNTAGSDRFHDQAPGAPDDTADSSCTFCSNQKERIREQMTDGMVSSKKIGKGYTIRFHSPDYEETYSSKAGELLELKVKTAENTAD